MGLMADEYRCSFCGAPRSEVHKLVESPLGVFICNECVFTSAHLMIFAKPEKARKVTDEPLYDELSHALETACAVIESYAQTCPPDVYDIRNERDNEWCQSHCENDVQSCWREYLLGRRFVTR